MFRNDYKHQPWTHIKHGSGNAGSISLFFHKRFPQSLLLIDACPKFYSFGLPSFVYFSLSPLPDLLHTFHCHIPFSCGFPWPFTERSLSSSLQLFQGCLFDIMERMKFGIDWSATGRCTTLSKEQWAYFTITSLVCEKMERFYAYAKSGHSKSSKKV